MKRNHNPPSSPRLIAQNDWDTTPKIRGLLLQFAWSGKVKEVTACEPCGDHAEAPPQHGLIAEGDPVEQKVILVVTSQPRLVCQLPTEA